MPRGGLRSNPGGRPKGTTGIKQKQTIARAEAQAVERESFRDFIKPHLADLHKAQIANAKGINYLVRRDAKTGKFVRITADLLDTQTDEDIIEMWTKDPSIHAYSDLMDRFLDKAKNQVQEVQITGELTMVPARLSASRKRLAANR
jgi:hypothetical protein